LEEKLMNTQVSKAVSNMTPSLTLSLSAKANELKSQGIDVCGFTAGEPDFDTPELIRKAAIAELEKGGKVCKYSPASGLPELKRRSCRNSNVRTASISRYLRSRLREAPNNSWLKPSCV
jgi:aspartate/methionine/tyrosine aminotransferase